MDINEIIATEAANAKNTSKGRKPKTLNLLEALENIVKIAEDSHLDVDVFKKCASYIKFASQKLNLTPMQTVFLAIFVDRSDDHSIRLSEIASFVDCRTARILRLSADIDVLESKRYIRGSRSRDCVSYRVPNEVLKALRKNEPYIYEEEPLTDTISFFERFDSLMNEMNDDEITHQMLLEETQSNIEEVKDTIFARALKRQGFNEEDTLLFIYMAHLFVENNDDNIRFSDIENIYDNDKIPHRTKDNLRSRKSPLFKANLIENVNEDGLARSDAFKLTDMAKEELLGELNLSTAQAKSDKGLILPDSFTEKVLIYNEKDREEIDNLASILTHERFIQVQERLEKAGMRKGFCCLFYGAPGTGKTETVYQLARKTGRKILRVDVDRIKSCWVGESEKNIKALFDRYRNICRQADKAPILLFNEADAVLGVRMEGASRAVDKMENSIQNIILQEMESLDGIMIATTNLTTNLDKAFERRFLYKVQFNRPTPEARAAIWQVMMPALSSEDAKTLGMRYDLSGGEIENIIRKQSVNAILSGEEIADLDAICKLCDHERISSSKQANQIGF